MKVNAGTQRFVEDAGPPLILTSRMENIVLAGAMLLVIAMVIFLCSAGYAHKMYLGGSLEPVNPALDIVSPVDGSIVNVMVQDGDPVYKGTALVDIKTSEGLQRILTLVADSHGTVTGLDLHAGLAVSKQSKLFTIVPQQDQWMINLYVASRDVSKLHEGDSVTVQIDALPFRQHGVQAAVIHFISILPVNNQVAPGGLVTPGINSQDVYYYVRLKLPDGCQMSADDCRTWRSGMRVTAIATGEKRRLIDKIFNPLASLGKP